MNDSLVIDQATADWARERPKRRAALAAEQAITSRVYHNAFELIDCAVALPESTPAKVTKKRSIVSIRTSRKTNNRTKPQPDKVTKPAVGRLQSRKVAQSAVKKPAQPSRKPSGGGKVVVSKALAVKNTKKVADVLSKVYLQYQGYRHLFAKKEDLSWTAAQSKTSVEVSVFSASQSIASKSAIAINCNPALLEISTLLMRREPLGRKPAPVGQPAVWAASREEMCETLPYYKSFHGGCYMNHGTVYSFMLDGSSQEREYMDEDVVICRAGGHMEPDGRGGITQGRDCSIRDTQPQAVLNNLRQQNPVIIICGDRNSASAVEMPHRFNVLGWFMPTHVWAEKVIGKKGKAFTTVRYRFERLGRSSAPWYSRQSSPLTAEQQAAIPPLQHHTCPVCACISPELMLSGWMCLNEACESFWPLDMHGQSSLMYHPSFLTHRSNLCQFEPFSVDPGIPRFGDHIGDNLQYINTRGIVCPRCGRCNQRYKFSGWECGSATCDWQLTPTTRLVTASNLHHNPWDIVATGAALTKTVSKSVVRVEVSYSHNYKVMRYTIPDVQGCIIHAKANAAVVQEEGGPDDIFRSLQLEDIGLVRRQFGLEKVIKAEIDETGSPPVLDNICEHPAMNTSSAPPPSVDPMSLDSVIASPAARHFSKAAAPLEAASSGRMSAFSMNFGMPYKFVAGCDSASFETSAWPIRACRSRLNWALRTFLGETDAKEEFNELLAIAYLEKQKIGYHDDGEAGLGSVIASLSLGAAATMSLRLKAKYYSGVSKAGIFTLEPPPAIEILRDSGLASMTPEQWQQRMDAYQELRKIKEVKSANIHQCSRDTAKRLDLRCKQAQSLLDLHLTHGDIVIMQGEQIQQYFEHAVEPHGSLRFALTCRQILPTHLSEGQGPAYEVLPDTYGYDGSQIRTTDDAGRLSWR